MSALFEKYIKNPEVNFNVSVFTTENKIIMVDDFTLWIWEWWTVQGSTINIFVFQIL